MIANFSIIPLGKEGSLSSYVAEIIKIVDKSGLSYKLHPMGTVVEGDCDEVFSLIKKCHLEMLKYSQRVLTQITIDDRTGYINRITEKVESVKQKAGCDIKTLQR
jgi:uncharacterized protein (TIGR00106 family)